MPPNSLDQTQGCRIQIFELRILTESFEIDSHSMPFCLRLNEFYTSGANTLQLQVHYKHFL